jgi:hypothetical protein
MISFNTLIKKKNFPLLMTNYINSTSDVVEKENRIKICKEIIGTKIFLYDEDESKPYNLINIIVPWLFVQNYTSISDLMNKIMICYNIIENKREYLESLCNYFFNNKQTITAILLVFPECSEIILNIIEERNTISYKLKHSKALFPAFNGSGCIIL